MKSTQKVYIIFAYIKYLWLTIPKSNKLEGARHTHLPDDTTKVSIKMSFECVICHDWKPEDQKTFVCMQCYFGWVCNECEEHELFDYVCPLCGHVHINKKLLKPKYKRRFRWLMIILLIMELFIMLFVWFVLMFFPKLSLALIGGSIITFAVFPCQQRYDCEFISRFIDLLCFFVYFTFMVFPIYALVSSIKMYLK